MCKVSDIIKFCTCDISDSDDVENYWILHRYASENENEIMGMVVMPSYISLDIVFHNEEMLLKRINETGAFDIELSHKPKDRLLIHLRCDEQEYNYGFVFKKKHWVTCKYDFFEWAYKHVESEQGKVEVTFETPDN